jgi:hypothetical protein
VGAREQAVCSASSYILYTAIGSIKITNNTFYLAPDFLKIILFFAYMKYAFIIFLSICSIALSAQNWKQQGFDIDGETRGDYSGYSVSLSSDGSTVAIGACGNGGNGGNSGHVRIYKNISGTQSQKMHIEHNLLLIYLLNLKL